VGMLLAGAGVLLPGPWAHRQVGSSLREAIMLPDVRDDVVRPLH
jgi:hypothetical protein